MSHSFNRDYSSSNSSLYRELRQLVSQLDFHSFQILVLLWLRAKGYSHFQSLGRLHLRGRRPFGGADYIAQVPGCSKVPVAIQIRHWKSPLQRRVVDELYGFLLRYGIPTGLIVTSSSVSAKALASPSEFPGRRVELVSVSRLVGSMVALGLGVTGDPLRVGRRFFNTLRDLTLASRLLDDPRAGRKCPTRVLVQPQIAADVALDPKQPSPSWIWLAVLALLLGLILGMTLNGGIR